MEKILRYCGNCGKNTIHQVEKGLYAHDFKKYICEECGSEGLRMVLEQEMRVASSGKEANKMIKEYKRNGFHVKILSFTITILFEKEG